MSEGTNAVLAVNGGARSALASLIGPASPIDSCAAAWTRGKVGISTQTNYKQQEFIDFVSVSFPTSKRRG